MNNKLFELEVRKIIQEYKLLEIEEEWKLYLEETLSLWDPTLQKMITRYYSNDDLNIKEPKR
jgi:hypothetical protein